MTTNRPPVGDTITTADDLFDLFADGIEYVVVATGWQPWLVTSTEDGDLVAWTWADEDTPTGKWPVQVVEKLPYPLTLLAFPPDTLAASRAVPSDHTATTEDALRDLDEGTVIVDATGEVLHYIDSGEALIWSDVWTNECHVSLPARVLFVPGDEVPR